MKNLQEILSIVIKNYKGYFASGIYKTPPETLDVFESNILGHFSSKQVNELNFLTDDGKEAYRTYNMDYYYLLEGWYYDELSSSFSDEKKIENLLDYLIGCSDEVL